MKKILKKTGKVLLIILACLAALLLLTTAINFVCCLIEKKQIPDYGTKMEVTGGTMNVGIFGDGEKVVVLLPGSGGISPVIDFKYLASLMTEDCTVVIPEQFGYGLSDITNKERTFENIADEIHQCLSQLGYEKYFLMGHSLSGITMLQYANMYPDEVTAVIALDTSVPMQTVGMSEPERSMGLRYTKLLRIARITGIIRIYFAFGGNTGIPEKMSAEDADTIKAMACASYGNRNVIEELYYFNYVGGPSMCDMTYPEGIPVLTFLSGDNVNSLPGWETWHRELSDNDKSRTEIVSGGHAVYWEHPEEIAEKTIDFIYNVEK